MELDAHRNTSSLANRRKGEVTGGEGKYQEIEQKSGKKVRENCLLLMFVATPVS